MSARCVPLFQSAMGIPAARESVFPLSLKLMTKAAHFYDDNKQGLNPSTLSMLRADEKVPLKIHTVFVTQVCT